MPRFSKCPRSDTSQFIRQPASLTPWNRVDCKHALPHHPPFDPVTYRLAHSLALPAVAFAPAQGDVPGSGISSSAKARFPQGWRACRRCRRRTLFTLTPPAFLLTRPACRPAGERVSQAAIIGNVEALVDRSRMVAGVNTSLWDLGYRTAGIDGGYELCVNGTMHDASVSGA